MTPTTYHIHRNNVLVASIIPSGHRQEAVMGVDVVTMSYQSKEYIEFLKGDTVQIGTQIFTLSNPAAFIREKKWNYNLEFLSKGYIGNDAQMFGLDENNALTEYECYLTGDANAAIDLIILNANRIGAGWVKGVVDATETVDFDFTGDTCNTALAKLSDQFKTEFWWDNDTIHLTKKGADSGLSFRHGKGKGLTKLERKNTGNKVVTRLHIYGSKQNLPTTYPGLSKRLRMPNGQKYIQDQAKVDKYGLIEETKVFEDVFPRRIGTITNVTNELTFSDSSIDFDLNTHLVDGVSAKVKFLTGQLAGYILEIKERGYNHATKTITVLVNKNEQAMVVPSALMKPAVGDQYIFLDVIMPAVDIANAEVELLAKGQEAYEATSDPIVQYDAITDRRYLRFYDVTIRIGDFANIAVPEAGIDKDIRIISKRTNLQDPYDVTIELADTTSVANIVKQLINEKTIQKAIKNTKATDIARQRLMWRTTAELSTMLDTLRGEMLLIMGEGGAYTTDIVVETNADNNPNGFATSAGEVIQEEYIDNGGIWQVDASSVVLADSGPYFVYIRASRVSTAATVVTSPDKIGVESDPAFYHFPLGALSSVFDGQRIFQTLQGYTRITANNIKTGRVEDVSGDNYFDLSAGTFNLGDEESGIDWNVTEPDKLTIRGFVIADDVQVGSNGVINAGISGDTSNGLDSVAIFSGGTKSGAPFRVTQRGDMYSASGYIGGFKILENSLESSGSYAGGKFVLYPNEGYIAFVNNSVGYWAGIGANIFPATAGVRGVARFENTGFSGADNYGAVITAKNGQNNISLLLTGNIHCMENTAIEGLQVKTQVVNGSYTVTTEGAIIVITNNSNITLPSNPSNGRTVSINRTHEAVLRISGNGKGVMIRDVYTAPGALTENIWGASFTYSSTLGYWVVTGFLP